MKLILAILIINLCFLHLYAQNHDTVYISDKPTNLKELNSVFDDYNSQSQVIISPLFMIHRLIFSTNRFSNGDNYDLISYRFDFLPVKQGKNEYSITYKISKDSLLNDKKMIILKQRFLKFPLCLELCNVSCR